MTERPEKRGIVNNLERLQDAFAHLKLSEEDAEALAVRVTRETRRERWARRAAPGQDASRD